MSFGRMYEEFQEFQWRYERGDSTALPDFEQRFRQSIYYMVRRVIRSGRESSALARCIMAHKREIQKRRRTNSFQDRQMINSIVKGVCEAILRGGLNAEGEDRTATGIVGGLETLRAI